MGYQLLLTGQNFVHTGQRADVFVRQRLNVDPTSIVINTFVKGVMPLSQFAKPVARVRE